MPIQLLETIVKRLVNNPDKIIIESDTSKDKILKIKIYSDKSDTAKIIGKKGNTIKALNTIIKNISIKENKKNVIIQIAE